MWDLHRLELLREFELLGTITAVAAALNYSPSSVSQQLATLEDEVGFALLEKDGRRLRLTEQGRVVAQYAARVMALEEQVSAELEQARPEVTGVVHLATPVTTAHSLLPRMLSILQSRHPGLRLEAAVIAPEEGLRDVETHRFDLAIAEQYPGHTRPQRPGVDRVTVGHDPIRLAVAATIDAHSLADARDLPWAVEPAGSAAQLWAVQQCRAAGFEPDIRFESADLQAHIRLVAAGHAVSLLPDLVWTDERVPVRLVDLPGTPRRELFTSARLSGTNRPAVTAMRSALQDAWTTAHESTPGYDI